MAITNEAYAESLGEQARLGAELARANMLNAKLAGALRQAQRQLKNANKHIDCDDEIAIAEAALEAAGLT